MTSPDTSTLNGALEQLGITMAENLVTMGVSDADPSDGLTTLAQKILQVSPTPTVDSLTLAKTAGKQILSYADSGATPETEYCTVTATALDSNNQGVSGQSVVFKVGTTTVATETTDSNGEASYTYTSQGSGDVVLSAECSSLIQTYSVQDCLYYDDASSDKSSNWTKNNNNTTISYDSTNHCYNLSRSADGDTMIIMTGAVIPDGVKFTCDVKYTGASNKNHQPRFGLANGNLAITGRLIYTSNLKSMGLFPTTDWTSGTWDDSYPQVTVNESLNTWYTIEISFNNGSITMTMFNGSTQMGTTTQSISGLSSTSNNVVLDTAYSNGASISIKNMKVKPL